MKRIFLFASLILICAIYFISCSKKEEQAPVASCSDGIKNQDETDIDCGGACAACPTCSDGIKNQGETGVDCGGPCPAVCPTCNDGIQNQTETGVDCGGTCPPCPVGSLTCLVDGVSWTADNPTIHFTTYYSIIGFQSSDGSNISITMPVAAAGDTGMYPINNLQCFYYVSSTTFPGTGTLHITSWNTALRLVNGSFSFTATPHDITNGMFSNLYYN